MENELLERLKSKFGSELNLRSLAVKNDAELLEFLLLDGELKARFFTQVAGAFVFKQSEFLEFLNLRILGESYTRFSNKIGLFTGEKFLRQNSDVVLNFPFKDGVLQGSQSHDDDKSSEHFFNEILEKSQIDVLLSKKVLTNFSFVGLRGETGECAAVESALKSGASLLLKGNNLLALHSLKGKFAKSVKLIYIDPPYNTGNDSFNYNDKFNHSTWLVFMKNRLEVAREFLREDGVIFVQCDDNEQAYLKVLMDEIFGRENFVNCIAVQVKSSAGFKTVNKGVMEVMEYILFYAKNKQNFKENKVYKSVPYDDNYSYYIENIEDNFTEWKISKLADNFMLKDLDVLAKQLNINKKELQNLVFSKFALENPNKIFRYTAINDDAGIETINAKNKSLLDDKIYMVETLKGKRFIHKGNQIAFYSTKIKNINGKDLPTEQISNIWTDIRWEGIAGEGQQKFKKGKKPEALLKRIIEISTNEGDLVMDFFAGSGTTAAVAHKMRRKFVAIEQMDYIENITKERLKKVVEGESGGVSRAVGWAPQTAQTATKQTAQNSEITLFETEQNEQNEQNEQSYKNNFFVYAELKELNLSFKKQIVNAKNADALKQIWAEVEKKAETQKAFLDFHASEEKFFDKAEFNALKLNEQKRTLKNALDANMDYLPLSELKDADFEVSEEEARLNLTFYEKGLF